MTPSRRSRGAKRVLQLTHALALLPALLGLAAHAKPKHDEPARVRAARTNKGEEVRTWFAEAKVAYPARAMLLRAFKHESRLELWAGDDTQQPLSLIHTFVICAKSGGPGPKRALGDGQVPEGFYTVSQLNPWSNFHLSLRVSYPNRADRRRSRAKRLGGNIFIHGDCVTIGCLPLEDGPIEALYLAALDAKDCGTEIAVQLFPCRMDEASIAALGPVAKGDPELMQFWSELRAGYDAFEATHVLPGVRIDAKGHYVVVHR